MKELQENILSEEMQKHQHLYNIMLIKLQELANNHLINTQEAVDKIWLEMLDK